MKKNIKPAFQRINLPCELGPDPGQPSLFGCHRIWKVEENEKYIVGPYQFSSFVFFYTYEGCGIIRIDGNQYEVRPYSLFIVNAGTSCAYACKPGGLWKFYFLMCIRNDAVRFLKLQSNTVYDSNSAGPLVHTFEAVLREGMTRRPGFGLKIDALATDILLCYAREAEEHATIRENSVKLFRTWMHQHVTDKLDLAPWIQKSGFCRTKFFREFLGLTGKTPVQYFMDLKLETARLMIENQPRAIREVSQDLSFFDEYYFSRLFKRKYGVPPVKYRKRFWK
jgi:AraC-like DNA-binding protein